MPEPLKYLYDRTFVDKLADEVAAHYSSFEKKKFVSAVFNRHWEAMELKQRMRHITITLHAHLPVVYSKQVAILKKAAPRFSGFTAMFFPDFIEVFGLEHPDVSIPALEHFTQYSSSEFAVRPFILKYTERMVKQHLEWSRHKNHHVRRLASEGIRPRLPWAMALPPFKKDPSELLPVLENLKQDESEYVRRSVANCLNDISKDHPGTLLRIASEWIGQHPDTDKILKHACRTLLKKGNEQALQIFGLDTRLNAAVHDLRLSAKKVAIGSGFDFSFTVAVKEKNKTSVRVEYRIYYCKSNGSLSAKVFQAGNYSLDRHNALTLKRKHQFANLTTRRHYPGAHKITIVVNGKELAEQSFNLTA